MSPTPPLRIKADRFLLPVILPVSTDLSALQNELREKLALAGDFLRQANLVLDASEWQAADAGALRGFLDVLHAEGLRVVGLRGAGAALLEAGRQAGLVLFQQEPRAERMPEEAPAPAPTSGSLVLEQPVRAGQQIYARGRDLVALHGVNVGGEVLADGSIHVYGRLAGRALAGAMGDMGARVYATHFAAQLVSIAGHFMLPDHPLMLEFSGSSVGVALRDEELVFEKLG
ncbi:MAG: septum site-determining protein MinC [Pseudomonadota bacterium]|uniref:septum site-determining protein MinC n=1 Tax=Thermithiobacillus tepidarius TaxID=929 RepID=UPI0009DBC178|nr:septum site-determining protein MinC [Thermithiobacillus tepidarius]